MTPTEGSAKEPGARLEFLEREQGRLRQQVRALGVGVVLLTLLLIAAGVASWRGAREAAPGDLRVRRLTLVDEAGRTRAELGFMPDGQEPHLVLSHPDGRPWATLSMAPPPGAPPELRQASLLLQDEVGKAAVSLGASGTRSGVSLHGAQGTLGVALYVEPDAQGLVISDGQVPRIHLENVQDEEASLSRLRLLDEQKREQSVLVGGPGGASFTLSRPDGERAFRAP